MGDLQQQHRVLFRFEVANPGDAVPIRLMAPDRGREKIHVDAVGDDVRLEMLGDRRVVGEQDFSDVLANRDQPIHPRPIDLGGKRGLQRLDGMQPQNAPLAVQAAGGGNPDRMIPAPLQPNNFRPLHSLSQSRSWAGGNKPHFMMPLQRGKQRGQKCVASILDPISQKQSCHRRPVASAAVARRVAFAGPCDRPRAAAGWGLNC
jgi:hypothetical protein